MISKDVIRRALQLADFDVAGAQSKMMPKPRGSRFPQVTGGRRQGGVLVILYEKNDQTYLVLTQRRDDLNDHAGQISFPGGRRERGETLQETALREAKEEVGIRPENLEILGHLECLYIPPTDYEVYPTVSWHHGRIIFKRQVEEVAEILEVPLSYLLDPINRVEELWELRGFEVQVPFFLVGSHKVWGATAMMLSEFLERIRQVQRSSNVR